MAVHFYNQETDYLPKGRVRINRWVRDTIHNEGLSFHGKVFAFVRDTCGFSQKRTEGKENMRKVIEEFGFL